MSYAPFHVFDIFDDVEDKYWFLDVLFSEIIEDHAPLKTKRITRNSLPYMTSELKKAIAKKASLKHKWEKFPIGNNFECFRRQRNYCSKLLRKAKRKYILEKCSEKKDANFYKIIKPFFNNNGRSSTDIQLLKRKRTSR